MSEPKSLPSADIEHVFRAFDAASNLFEKLVGIKLPEPSAAPAEEASATEVVAAPTDIQALEAGFLACQEAFGAFKDLCSSLRRRLP